MASLNGSTIKQVQVTHWNNQKTFGGIGYLSLDFIKKVLYWKILKQRYYLFLFIDEVTHGECVLMESMSVGFPGAISVKPQIGEIIDWYKNSD